jgi:hypothetical protein
MSLQDDLEAREWARIEAKRVRMAQLAEKFQDTKRRTMGLDVDALDQQIADKRIQEQHNMQEELDDIERARAIARYLDQQDAKEEQDRRQFVQDLASEWGSMMEDKHHREQEEKEEDRKLAQDLISSNPSHVGKSALINFSGEDFLHEDRERMKKAQMNTWIRQQMEEKRRCESKEREEDEQAAFFMQSVVQLRNQLDEEDELRHKQFLLDVREENKKLAEDRKERERRQREQEEELARQEIDRNVHSSMLSERLVPSTATDGFVPRDAFRGFSQAQVRAIFRENQEQEEARKDQDDFERDEDLRFQDSMGSVNRYLDWQERQERREKERLKQEHLEGLRQQMEEQRMRREKDREEKFGSVNNDFFDAFGKSAR